MVGDSDKSSDSSAKVDCPCCGEEEVEGMHHVAGRLVPPRDCRRNCGPEDLSWALAPENGQAGIYCSRHKQFYFASTAVWALWDNVKRVRPPC